jgi:hypothetical protein
MASAQRHGSARKHKPSANGKNGKQPSWLDDEFRPLPDLSWRERMRADSWIREFYFLILGVPERMVDAVGWDEASTAVNLLVFDFVSKLANELSNRSRLRRYETLETPLSVYRAGQIQLGAVWLPRWLARGRLHVCPPDNVFHDLPNLKECTASRTADWLRQLNYLESAVPEWMIEAFGWDDAATMVAELIFSVADWLADELRKSSHFRRMEMDRQRESR